MSPSRDPIRDGMRIYWDAAIPMDDGVLLHRRRLPALAWAHSPSS
jgi:hypothetical protein